MIEDFLKDRIYYFCDKARDAIVNAKSTDDYFVAEEYKIEAFEAKASAEALLDVLKYILKENS